MCTMSRATGRAASGLVTLAVLMLLGCERLPDSYGVYYKKNGRWTPINESTAEVQLPARPEILVFDRRLAMAPVPPEAIVKFERRQLVRRKIELVMIK
jgi:hypothetical protein